MSHLCHAKHPESIGSDLRGEGTGQELGIGVEIPDRADPLAFNINNPVLVHHGRGRARQSAELDLILGQGWWRHLGRRGRNCADARRQGISFALTIASTDRETMFTVGQVGDRARERRSGADDTSSGIGHLVADNSLRRNSRRLPIHNDRVVDSG